jgi:hypothetical protein
MIILKKSSGVQSAPLDFSNSHYKNRFFESPPLTGFKKQILVFPAPSGLEMPKSVSY